jgi:putative transcriptional regulator
MSIAHHLDDATLMSCAAGTLPAPLAIVAASHVSLCPHCRDGLADAERLGGALLKSLPPASLAGGPVLPQTAPPRRPLSARPSAGGDVPPPLARLLGSTLDAIRWWPLGLGVWQHRIPLPTGTGRLLLIKVAPGRDVPEHGHNGSELTLVLQGAYRDEIGRFATGDVADLDESVEHRPVADPSAGCICVLGTERPARFRGLLARLMQPLTGL